MDCFAIFNIGAGKTFDSGHTRQHKYRGLV